MSKDPDKLIPGITTYPNLGPPEVLPKGYKQIKALPGHQTPAPKIRWGKKFEKMSVDQQIRRAKKVADAMNHAADIAQQRVAELIDIANHQEKQLEATKQAALDMQRTMNMQMAQHNADTQARIKELQELKMERARLIDALHLLAAGEMPDADPVFVADVLAGRWNASMEERKEIAKAKQAVRKAEG